MSVRPDIRTERIQRLAEVVEELDINSTWDVHGGMDGFSRLPVYLRCSTTNTAEKVFEYFLDAVQRYGRPLRVRSDMGGENIRPTNMLVLVKEG